MWCQWLAIQVPTYYIWFQEVFSANEENLVIAYDKHWQRYSQGSQYINHLYSYLNQQFIKRNKSTEAEFNYGEITVDAKQPFLEIGEVCALILH